MKTQSFEIIDHGVDHCQYFQGCGISFTQFTDVATGCGMNEREALDDALDSLAQNGWDVSEIEASPEYLNSSVETPEELESEEVDELYYYVSVRVA